jgi:ABC-2 type transport system ATP-binding protein
MLRVVPRGTRFPTTGELPVSHAIELEKVSKRFDNCLAVDNLDLAVPEGTIYGFIGPNGSGKTTTLRMILRILYPDSGQVTVLGRRHGGAADDRVGYLPEERGLYKKMRVREVLRFFARLKGIRGGNREIDDWLERFDLARWANEKVETLSKGMSQKVQFIAAVIARPQLLVLDEPFGGLDPVNMDLLRDAVRSLHQGGATVIFSTHDMDVAERLCDTIFMIYRGRKVLDGTLAAIQAQFGDDTIRVRTRDADRSLADLPGVIHVNDYRHYKELRTGRDADPQAILQELLKRTAVEHFELARPSLHDIFVRIAGPENVAANDKPTASEVPHA